MKNEKHVSFNSKVITSKYPMFQNLSLLSWDTVATMSPLAETSILSAPNPSVWCPTAPRKRWGNRWTALNVGKRKKTLKVRIHQNIS